MKKLNRINPPYHSFLQQIFDAKKEPRRSALNSIYNEVKARYETYQIHFDHNSIQTISNSIFNGEIKEHLLHCYESSTKSLDKLKSDIKTSQSDIYQSLCPYCGIGIPNTFDHYIPKEEFSEFSTLPINLIPCCSTCNEYKSSKWRDNDNRLFINYYLDDFFDNLFLISNITIDKDDLFIIRFELIKSTNLSKDDFEIIYSHFSNLHLESKFKEFSSGFINEQLISLKNYSLIHKWENEFELKRFIFTQVESFKKIYGLNNIKTVLMFGLYNSKDFINYILKNPILKNR